MTPVLSTGKAQDRLISSKSGEAAPAAKGIKPRGVVPQRGNVAVVAPDAFALTGAQKTAPIQANERQALATELEVIFTKIDEHYGPRRMKAESIGLDWAAVKQEFRQKLQSITTLDDFYFLVSAFLARLDDAHVSVTLPSSRTFTLPMQLSDTPEGLVVNYVGAGAEESFERVPEVGDIVVAINGMTPAAFQAQYPQLNKFGNKETNKAMFARSLSGVSEAQGISLATFPKELSLTVRTEGGETYTTKATYAQNGVGLIGRQLRGLSLPPESMRITGLREEVAANPLGKLMEHPIFATALKAATKGARERLEKIASLMQRLDNLVDLRAQFSWLGGSAAASGQGQKIQMGHAEPTFKLPEDFERIKLPLGLDMAVNGVLFAGTFEHKGKRVGLLRIASYVPSVMPTSPLMIRYYMKQLREKSDVLIIDQQDNPGGAVVFSDLLLKGLIGKLDPEKHMRFAVKPTQSFLRTYAELIEALEQSGDDESIPADAKADFAARLKEDFDKVKLAYERGDDLSEPIALWTISEVLDVLLTSNSIMKAATWALGVKDQETYDKPTHFLINQMDFSGGDATPANFQDYGRGQLIGVGTAGAGGSVEEHQHRMKAEFSYRLTASLMVRPGGRLVENYRVLPDVNFATTAQDYRDGHATFLPRLLAKIGI